MIRVDVNLIPASNPNIVRQIKAIEIENIGGTDLVGKYKYRIIGGEGDDKGSTFFVEYEGILEKHRRKENVLVLLEKVLKDYKKQM